MPKEEREKVLKCEWNQGKGSEIQKRDTVKSIHGALYFGKDKSYLFENTGKGKEMGKWFHIRDVEAVHVSGFCPFIAMKSSYIYSLLCKVTENSRLNGTQPNTFMSIKWYNMLRIVPATS